MKEIILKLISSLVSLLPVDPFPNMIKGLHDILHPYLGWLNWFVPIAAINKLFLIWLGAVAVWYAWRALAGFLHLVS